MRQRNVEAPDLSNLPQWMQWAFTFVVGVIIAVAGKLGYSRPRKPGAEDSDIVIAGGALADRPSMQRLAGAIDALTIQAARIADVLEKEHHEDEIERRARILAEQMAAAKKR